MLPLEQEQQEERIARDLQGKENDVKQPVSPT